MKSKINVNREIGTSDNSKRRGLEASVLIDAGSPINAGSLLNAGFLRSVFK